MLGVISSSRISVNNLFSSELTITPCSITTSDQLGNVIFRAEVFAN